MAPESVANIVEYCSYVGHHVYRGTPLMHKHQYASVRLLQFCLGDYIQAITEITHTEGGGALFGGCLLLLLLLMVLLSLFFRS